jgi:purine-cytosine permease-like protein
MDKQTFHIELDESAQSAWKLSYIQLAGVISIPSLTSSILLSQKYSFLSCLFTILIANIILWIVRYGIIKITHKSRKSTLDIAYDYFGKIGALVIAIALLIDTIAWFFIHTSVAGDLFISLTKMDERSNINHFVQISSVIGIVCTLFCMQGMRSLRRLALITLPVLIGIFILLITTSYTVSPKVDLAQEFTIAGLGMVLGYNLGFSIDLPTFFRHRRSWKDSVNALAIFQIISFLISLGGLFLGNLVGLNENTGNYQAGLLNDVQTVLLIAFILFSAIYANVYNVYSSSVAWEILAPAPTLVGRKEYMILGLSLTILFISFYKTFSIHTLLDIADSAMINLCLILFWVYITKNIFKKEPSSSWDRHLFHASWLVTSALNTTQVIRYGFISNQVLITSTVLLSLFPLIRQILIYLRKRRE